MALSADGTKATAVWLAPSQAAIRVASATISENTATWSTATDITVPGVYDNVGVALSADGTKATAMWEYNGSGNKIVQAASATVIGNTATWSSPTDLSAVGYNGYYYPQVALSTDGTKATAVWQRSNGTNLIIQAVSATISGNTATWSNTTDLSAILHDAGGPQVALSADGTKAIAAWARSNGTNTIVQAASATVSGTVATWGSTTDLSATLQDAGGPQIALSLDGTKAIAMWARSNGTNKIVQAASATISGTAATWSRTSDLSATGQDAGGGQIALSADGTMATAVWERGGILRKTVQTSSYFGP